MKLRGLFFALFSVSFLGALGATANPSTSKQAARRRAAENVGTLHRRSYFYVGGVYDVLGQNGSALSSEQTYVEHLLPQNIKQRYPIVIIPGYGMTGTNFLNTPDGRRGWADYFLEKGYELFILDQPSRGRSPWQPGIDGTLFTFDSLTIEERFTAAQKYDLWPEARLHTQWPGEGVRGDKIFDNFYRSIVPSLLSNTDSSQKTTDAAVALLDEIGPAVILTHSQSGMYSWPIADVRPTLVKAIITLEPNGPPFINAVFPPFTADRPYGLSEIPLQFSPPIQSAADLQPVVVSSTTNFTCMDQSSPPRKLVNLLKIPVLFITSESGYHSVYDRCSVSFLKNAGVNVDHANLGEVGIHGNGHMMFMEKNNIDIADKVIHKWLKERF
ncbi:alpha/beta-hydrolase [Agrocybe pediades]|nr:alpha/beta-hydrolase [Agrocybe pediades]